MSRDASQTVRAAAQAILRQLRGAPDGLSKAELAATQDVSPVTVQRALVWLRDEADAPVVFERTHMRWRLTDLGFSLPLVDPVPGDLQAVLFASSLLEPLVDRELAERLRRLVEEMDQRVRASASPLSLRPGTVTATISQGHPIPHTTLDRLLRAVGRHPIVFDYQSPWDGPSGGAASRRRRYRVEPWQLRIHDNRLYLRGYSLDRGAPRSFRVVLMRAIEVDDVKPLGQPIPGRELLWDEGDPAFGIDHDRPDVARVRLRGGVARWAALERWHDEQVDRWVEVDELLERVVPYASCREFARRLMSVADGLVSVDPPALRAQLASLAQSVARVVEPGATEGEGPETA